MLVKAPIRQIYMHEVQTPDNFMRIEEARKTGEVEMECTDEEAAKEFVDSLSTSDFLKESIFTGIGHILVQYGPFPEQVRPQEVRFNIEADTLTEAFQKYEQSAQEELERLTENQQKASQELIVPDNTIIT